jgi:hypothetical protein
MIVVELFVVHVESKIANLLRHNASTDVQTVFVAPSAVDITQA